MRAKSNVERFYPVVGITENINMTLKVLQNTMPEYFKDAFHEYHNQHIVQNSRNINKYKLPVREETLEKIKDKFSNELEFYHFCKKRLQSQLDKIKS